MQYVIRDGGCLSKISIDIETLQREKPKRGAFFCSLSGILNSKKSGGSNHLNLEESADEPKRRKKTAFGSGNTMSKGVNALRADLQTSEKTTLELKTENEESQQ